MTGAHPALDTAPAPLAERPGATVPAVILAGSGYVGGELLRWILAHPVLRPAAVVSGSRAGQPVVATFPHLAGALPASLVFATGDELPRLLESGGPTAVFCAAPHGEAAAMIDGTLTAAGSRAADVRVVDASADFRFATAGEWEAVYRQAHGAPDRLAEFARGVPELVTGVPLLPGGEPARCVAHPGCFTTAVLLAAVPLVRLGLVEPDLAVVAVTGSTGAGRTPTPTTHHPERRSDLFAYAPLAHRHQPEMEALAAAAGAPARIRFVPQAGPFARGIHATLVARPRPGVDAAGAVAALQDFYTGSAFVTASATPPRLAEVAGSNRCRLAVAADGDTLVAFSAIDNLVKGAAGGAIQWMNRLLGLPESTGLTMPGPGWL